MPRPALVIGLGGTGQWVLTYLKQDLLDSNEGLMPSNVHLLAFDTAPQTGVDVRGVPGLADNDDAFIQLTPDQEFISLACNFYPMIEAAAAGELPAVQSWFAAEYLLSSLPTAALTRNPGSMRPMGRLALFHDLISATHSRLWTSLTTAIEAVKNQISDQQQLEIIVVSSLAGGTGSGMFLDVANLVRSAATRVLASNFIVRGMLVLPRAFSINNHIMKARAFAAWRELDRFMINDPDMGKKVIGYSDSNNEFNLSWKQRIFDACYMLDPGRDNNHLTGLAPEEALFPCISDIISALLDRTAGELYTQWVTTNLAPIYAQNKDKPMYSSLGAYTIKVPLRQTLQRDAYHLAINFLDEWLQPEQRDSRIVGLAPNRNPTAPGGEGKSGVNGAYDFLALPTFSRQGEDTIAATGLTQKIHEALNQAADRYPATQSALVDAYARGSLMSNNPTWLLPFAVLGDDETARQISRIATTTLYSNIPRQLLRTAPTASAFANLIARVNKYKRTYFGSIDDQGSGVYGTFATILSQCKDAHLTRFRQTLRLALLNILMPQRHHDWAVGTGTLGYAVEFVHGLADYFDRFLDFMTAVQQRRMAYQLEDEQTAVRAQALAEPYQSPARHRLQQLRRAVQTTLNPNVANPLRAYLAAEQTSINRRKEHLLHNAVTDTVSAMRDYAIEQAAALDAWATRLAVSDDEADTPSLIETLSSRLAQLEATASAEGRVQKVRVDLEPDSSTLMTHRVIKQLLSRLRWSVETDSDTPAFSLNLDPKPASSVEANDSGHSFACNADNDTGDIEALLSACLGALDTPHHKREIQIAPVLAESYTGDQLAQEMHGKADPLYRKIGRGPRSVSCFIRVHSKVGKHEVERVFSDAETRLQALSTGIPVKMIESDDAYKCTMVRSDDCIESRHFAAWKECQDEYIHAITDAHEPADPCILHIFPAEVNASYYERQLDKLEKDYRTFSPQVVMMLDDIGKVRTFFMAYLLDMFKVQEDVATTSIWYELELNDGSSPLHLTRPNVRWPDLFTLMNSFVNIGRDVRGRMDAAIPYPVVEATIELQLKAMGDYEARIAWLRRQMDGELHAELITKANWVEEGNHPAYENPEYADLADLLRLILLERIEALEDRRAAVQNGENQLSGSSAN